MWKIDPDIDFDGNNVNTPGLFQQVQHAESTALVRLEFTMCNYNATSRCWVVKQELTFTFYLLQTLLSGQLIAVGFGFGIIVIRK